MILIDLMDTFLKRLKKSGWKQNGGYAIQDNPRVLERNGKKIAVIKPIKVDPYKILQDEIDKFFRSLTNIILKNGITDVFLQGGGTIPIPQFFLDFCKENGIKIHIVTNELLDQFENWDI
jgi:hypothetical protein